MTKPNVTGTRPVPSCDLADLSCGILGGAQRGLLRILELHLRGLLLALQVRYRLVELGELPLPLCTLLHRNANGVT